MKNMNRMTINLNYTIDVASAFILGLVVCWLLCRPCEPTPPQQEAKKAPVEVLRKPHVVPQEASA